MVEEEFVVQEGPAEAEIEESNPSIELLEQWVILLIQYNKRGQEWGRVNPLERWLD